MARDSIKFEIFYMEQTMLDVNEELKFIWSYLPEDVDGLSKEGFIAQIAEIAVESEEAEFGDILGTDRDAVVESIIRGLNEVHAMLRIPRSDCIGLCTLKFIRTSPGS